MNKSMLSKFLLIIVILLVGILIGGTTVWVDSYLDKNAQPEVTAGIRILLTHSHLVMGVEGSCQRDRETTVAEVVSSMLAVNLASKRNRLDFYCVSNTCAFSLSACKPWSLECGQRVLLYDFIPGDETNPSNFRCMDIP